MLLLVALKCEFAIGTPGQLHSDMRIQINCLRFQSRQSFFPLLRIRHMIYLTISESLAEWSERPKGNAMRSPSSSPKTNSRDTIIKSSHQYHFLISARLLSLLFALPHHSHFIFDSFLSDKIVVIISNRRVNGISLLSRELGEKEKYFFRVWDYFTNGTHCHALAPHHHRYTRTQ